MCDLSGKLMKLSAIGYKVVAKHNLTGRYHSVAFGFEYEQPKMRFCEITEQTTLSDYFRNDILHSPAHRNRMIGRTAAFKLAEDAVRFFIDIKDSGNSGHYSFVVVKVKLTKNLMKGDYSDRGNVVAGSTMEILEEVEL